MKLYDSPYLQTVYDENLKAVLEEWKLDFTTQVDGVNFRKPLEQLIATFKEKKAYKWLCDNTEQKNLVFADQYWLETFYYPELIKNGLKKVALVNAKNILGTGYAKNCLKNINEAVEIEIFNKRKDAIEWLKKV